MDSKKVGERLIKLRGNRTQQEVADMVGISVSAMGMYERGERIPRDEIKIKLAKEYDTTVQDLFFSPKDTHRVERKKKGGN